MICSTVDASAAIPGLWCFAGPPGSGKSTLGRTVAAQVGACLLDLDTATNPLIAQIAVLTDAGHDLDHPSLRGTVRAARYRCLTDLAAENILVGRSVVLVAPFTREGADAETWQQLAQEMLPAVPVLIWVDVPPAVALQRRRERGHARDQTASSLTGQTLAAQFPRPVVDHVLANGAAPTKPEAERLVGLLGTRANP